MRKRLPKRPSAVEDNATIACGKTRWVLALQRTVLFLDALLVLAAISTYWMDRYEFLPGQNRPQEAISTNQTSTISSSSAPPPRKDPIAQSCVDLQESTLAFSQDIYQDPENAALSPWKKGLWEIPVLDTSLLLSAFGGKKVIILGDSTLAYTMDSIHKVMEGTPLEEVDNLQHKLLSEANLVVGAAPSGMGGEYKNYNDSKIHWLGFRGSTMDLNCNFQPAFNHIRQTRPDILLVNWGLHILFNGPSTKICNIFEWVHYEAWLEQVLEVAHQAGTKVLLFKTNNRLCRKPTFDPVGDCRAFVANLTFQPQSDPVYMTQLSKEEKDRYCNEGLFLDYAAEQLNDRLKPYVAKAQETEKYSILRMAVLDDHAMQSCETSTDGIHQLGMQLPRIRLFAHMANCLYEKERHLDTSFYN